MFVSKQKNQEKRLLISINLIRAIASLGVLFYHQHLGMLLIRYTSLNIFWVIDSFGAYYAVPLFFLVSGYCIHLSNIKHVKNNESLPLAKYYKRRLIRIYPPYIFALITTLILNYYLDKGRPFPDTNDLIIHILAFQGFFVASFNSINVVLWTISIELAFYLIYPLFYYIRLKYSLNIALLFTLIISVISISYFTLKGNNTLPQNYFVLNLWCAWCCGAYLADKKSFNDNKYSYSLYHKFIYVLITICLIILEIVNNPTFFIILYQFRILIWTVPIIFLLSKETWLKSNWNLFVRIVSSIGLSSYSLYLLHSPLINLKNYIANTYFVNNIQSSLMLIGFILIPLFTWFIYLIFEKPFIKKGS